MGLPALPRAYMVLLQQSSFSKELTASVGRPCSTSIRPRSSTTLSVPTEWAFSQFALNGAALLIVFTMPIALTNIGWKTYMANGAWDAAMVAAIMYYWVETKGKTLEEIDAVLEGTKHSNVPDLEMI